ncbi:mitochondrial fission ELM1 family protein [Methylosinus sp. H3A]|uniref:mitochondrial fission ELM1 family protein n=1 Tax=Methylosinus sp. H3A TaxID=2785786 RepID=UPI0018C26003|nr:mitochondrial fission ELM1 family protein [Methylosinus sp. H3A]MBG0812111.1 mitochondrial fission ELM1 family protein [Methylosinus sp. H3A]
MRAPPAVQYFDERRGPSSDPASPGHLLPRAGEGRAPWLRPTTAWILSDGRAGHEVQSLGIAEALDLAPRLIRLAPRGLIAALAPFGPIDPREAALLAPPYPDLVIACGRRTIPYLRHVKRASGGAVFTVYVNRPASGLGTADVIVAPRHDGLEGENVIAPLAPANRLTPQRLAEARAALDPRIAALPEPRVGLLIGGDSRHFRYSAGDAERLLAAVGAMLEQGWSVAATVSRRTPAGLVEALRARLVGPHPTPLRGAAFSRAREKAARAFLWAGDGENPYLSILAGSQALLVTADSVNMVAEAASTGAPVHVFAPDGGGAKIAAFLDGLEAHGAVRRWRGRPEHWRYEPLNETPSIAAEIARRYALFHGKPLAAQERRLRRNA